MEVPFIMFEICLFCSCYMTLILPEKTAALQILSLEFMIKQNEQDYLIIVLERGRGGGVQLSLKIWGHLSLIPKSAKTVIPKSATKTISLIYFSLIPYPHKYFANYPLSLK